MLTGWGAVHHSARVRAGESVVVLGVGGVGLATLQAARIAGAGPIVAVDVSPGKEELARAAGATEFVVAGDDTAKRVRALTGGVGADVAIECVGRADVYKRQDQQVTFSALELFYFGRTLSGCVYGNSDPATDLPAIAVHVRSGALDLSAMVTERIGLDDIPSAFEAMVAGKGGRALVVF